MKLLTKNIFELGFFSFVTIIGLGLFITAFTEGFIIQVTRGDSLSAFTHYISALLSLIVTAFVFVRAKRVLTILSRSDMIEKFFTN